MSSVDVWQPVRLPNCLLGPAWLSMMAGRLDLRRSDRSPHVTDAQLHLAQRTEAMAQPDPTHLSSSEVQRVARAHHGLNMLAANVCPDRMVMYILGRPVVSLVITHEASKMENENDHLAKVWTGVPLYYVMGRSAHMEPRCPTREALWWTWKDMVSRFLNKPDRLTFHRCQVSLRPCGLICPIKYLFSTVGILFSRPKWRTLFPDMLDKGHG
mgnify:FL=1